MKKIILLIANAFLIVSFANAQNSFPASGNVGIGTSNPGNNVSFSNVTDDNGTSGITWYNPNPTAYGIYKTLGSWSSPNYQQLALQWATGIVLNPGNVESKSYVDVQGGGLRVTSGYLTIGPTGSSERVSIATSDKGTPLSFKSGSSGIWAMGTDVGSTGNGETFGIFSYTHDNLVDHQSNPLFQINASTGNIFLSQNHGNVLIGKIGQINPNYRLDVKGAVRADEITVNTSGADFVFAKKYRLNSLAIVRKYIEKNHHLPEIASAKEMSTDGMDLGEMNKKLLQKVEELTLYLIEKDRNDQVQRREIDLLKKQVKTLLNNK